MNKTDRVRMQSLLNEAAERGYKVEYVEWCEDAETPGIPGQIAGKCDSVNKVIKIRKGIIGKKRLQVLEHELEHAKGREGGTVEAPKGHICGKYEL